jgi:hypothetical protein
MATSKGEGVEKPEAKLTLAEKLKCFFFVFFFLKKKRELQN